jgi:hypothetical protein
MWLPRSCVALWQLAFANRAQLPPDLLHQVLTWQIDDRNIWAKRIAARTPIPTIAGASTTQSLM